MFIIKCIDGNERRITSRSNFILCISYLQWKLKELPVHFILKVSISVIKCKYFNIKICIKKKLYGCLVNIERMSDEGYMKKLLYSKFEGMTIQKIKNWKEIFFVHYCGFFVTVQSEKNMFDSWFQVTPSILQMNNLCK